MLQRVASALWILAQFGTWVQRATAYDNNAYDNVVAYWGQNSNGWLNPDNPDAAQKRLGFYCDSDSPVDVFPIAFLNTFYAQGGLPALDLSNICASYNTAVFPNTSLPDCGFLAADIEACQARGKIVTLSLGGASASTDFKSNSEAEDFAKLMWNMFLGGDHQYRPFGRAVLDGLDLDLEGGGLTGDVAFVNKVRELTNADTSKRYYITAAPQCPYPDVNLQGTLNSAQFDAVYVQMYNNYCGLPKFNTSAFNIGVVFLGAPGSKDSAGSGYVPIDELKSIATTVRNAFPSFGGVMFWDMSTSYANNRIDQSIKDALVAAGSTGFTYAKCDAPNWVQGQTVKKGSKVVKDGYIWQANADVTSKPGIDPPNDEWAPITACGSAAVPPSTGTKPAAPSSTCASCGPTSPASDPGLSGVKGRKGYCVVRPSKKKLLDEL
ncbi:glycoside hydrolase [Auriculariales sp. MPI-PUGE-AT-0066]|nr:glycoside hydrolase [Auriculariales sp. MPI-PUGE-AT-0066]